MCRLKTRQGCPAIRGGHQHGFGEVLSSYDGYHRVSNFSVSAAVHSRAVAVFLSSCMECFLFLVLLLYGFPPIAKWPRPAFSSIAVRSSLACVGVLRPPLTLALRVGSELFFLHMRAAPESPKHTQAKYTGLRDKHPFLALGCILLYSSTWAVVKSILGARMKADFPALSSRTWRSRLQ